MRNPIRLKNLSPRFLPFYAAGALIVGVTDVAWRDFWLAVPLVVGGLVLRAWATGHLIKNERFTVTGPYAHLRHPLYLGTASVASGFALALGGWTGLAVLTGFVAWFALSYFPRKEEAESERLRLRYGSVFEHYREQVPALVPRLRAWQPSASDAEKLETGLDWSFGCYDENNELGTGLAVLGATVLLALRAALG
jgi:hypothetical protein